MEAVAYLLSLLSRATIPTLHCAWGGAWVTCLQTSVAHIQVHPQSSPLRGRSGAIALLVLMVRVRHQQ